MSLTKNQYEYINEDLISNELKCIICTQPFQSPVNVDCKHIFCLSCIERWLKQNSSCPICRHQFGSKYKFNKLTSNISLNQLDCLQVRCLKCNKSDIERVNFKAHSERCSKEKIMRTTYLLHRYWQFITTMMQIIFHYQRTVTTVERTAGTGHERVDVQYGRYRSNEQSFNLITNASQESRIVTAAATELFEHILIQSVETVLTCMRMIVFLVSLVTFVVAFILFYLGIFWKVSIVIFLIWLALESWRTNK